MSSQVCPSCGAFQAVLQSVALRWIQKSRGAGRQPQQSPRGRVEPAPGFTGRAGSHAATLFAGAMRNPSSSKGSLHCQLTLCSRASGRASLHIPAGLQLSKTYAEIHHSPTCQLHMSIMHTGLSITTTITKLCLWPFPAQLAKA